MPGPPDIVITHAQSHARGTAAPGAACCLTLGWEMSQSKIITLHPLLKVTTFWRFTWKSSSSKISFRHLIKNAAQTYKWKWEKPSGSDWGKNTTLQLRKHESTDLFLAVSPSTVGLCRAIILLTEFFYIFNGTWILTALPPPISDVYWNTVDFLKFIPRFSLQWWPKTTYSVNFPSMSSSQQSCE